MLDWVPVQYFVKYEKMKKSWPHFLVVCWAGGELELGDCLKCLGPGDLHCFRVCVREDLVPILIFPNNLEIRAHIKSLPYKQ